MVLIKRYKPEGAATCWNTGESVLWVMNWAKKGKVVADVTYWWQLPWRTVLSKVMGNTNIFHLF